MPGSYSQILLHIVFSTKHRQPWITPGIAERLYPYMGGIVRAEKGVPYDIGGVEDHVHMYIRWRPDATVSDLMRTVKARSSKWVHETFPGLEAFTWQEGYCAFTVSKSQEQAVKKYIAGQAEHHKNQDFKSELLRWLRCHGIEFDEKYVFDGFAARPGASFAPPGQSRLNAPFHGFHSAGLSAGYVPPVATIRGPSGASRKPS